MKKLITILFVALFMLTIGCTVKGEAQSPQVVADGPTAGSSGEVSAEAMPKFFSTVDEMVNAVQQERQAKSKDSIAQANELEELSDIYAPANEFDGFQLLDIEVNPYSIFYYYMPVDNTSYRFSSSEGILVTLYRNTEFDASRFFAANGYRPDADGFAYEPENCEIAFIQDDTAMSVQVPEYMNDYDTIRSLCEMEKIEIP